MSKHKRKTERQQAQKKQENARNRKARLDNLLSREHAEIARCVVCTLPYLCLASILHREVGQTKISCLWRKVGELHRVVAFQHHLRLSVSPQQTATQLF